MGMAEATGGVKDEGAGTGVATGGAAGTGAGSGAGGGAGAGTGSAAGTGAATGGAGGAGTGQGGAGAAGATGGAAQGSGAGEGAIDWSQLRTKLAGSDQAKLARLARYASAEDFANAHFALVQKISSGELRGTTPFPDKGSDAEKQAWRAEHGVPVTPDKYEIKLPQGQVLGDDDQPRLKEFLTHMHNVNAPPEAVNAGVQWWMNAKAQAVKDQADRISQQERETEDALRASWGNDYRANMTLIENYLAATISANDKEMREAFQNSIKRDPKFANWLANTVRQANPTSTLTGLEAGASVDTITTELEKIREVMRTDRPKYNKDLKMQERYQMLLDAKARFDQQSRAA